jgi:hypothetical protein
MACNPIIREPLPKVPTPTDETPRACLDGYVHMGFEDKDEDGEPIELVERLACRRCRPETH